MSNVPVALVALFVVCLLIGPGCLFLIHCRCMTLARWGRRLFVLVLSGLGAGGLVAASHRPDALPPLGLLIGLLTVALLWETPAPELDSPPSP